MKRLIELRKEMNLSQAELAANLNLSQQVICRYELGRSIPDIHTLKRIADFFDTSIDYLVENDNANIEIEKNQVMVEQRPLSNKEIELITRYRKLPNKYKEDVDDVIEDLIEFQNRR